MREPYNNKFLLKKKKTWSTKESRKINFIEKNQWIEQPNYITSIKSKITTKKLWLAMPYFTVGSHYKWDSRHMNGSWDGKRTFKS